MQLASPRSGRRRGIAGLVAAVILFTLLFTVGVGFYTNLNAMNVQSQQDQNARVANQQASLQENLDVSAMLLANGTGPARDLGFVITNSGGVTSTVAALFVTDSAGVTHSINGSTPPLPITLIPTASTGFLDSTVDCHLATSVDPCTIKVVTSLGNVYSASYPSNPDQQSQSQALGVFSVDPNSFDVACSSCLSGPGSAYSIPGGTNALDINITVSNTDLCQRTITLDPSLSILTLTFISNSSTIANAGNHQTNYYYVLYLASPVVIPPGGQNVTTFSNLTLYRGLITGQYAASVYLFGSLTASPPQTAGVSISGQTCPSVALNNYGQALPVLVLQIY